MFRCEDSEDRRQWAQAISYMKDQHHHSNQQQAAFEKFSCVKEPENSEMMFKSDPISYSLPQKMKMNGGLKNLKKKARFDIENLEVKGEEVVDGTLDRSIEELSLSDDEKSEVQQKHMLRGKDGVKLSEESASAIFHGLVDIVKVAGKENEDPKQVVSRF